LMAGTSLYKLHNRCLQKPYAVYLYSHSVYIYIAAEVFSQTVVSCNETMGERFIGQLINPVLVYELEAMGIDACGENGEYHTLVLDCPLFSKRINVKVTEKLLHGNYWFSKLELQ